MKVCIVEGCEGKHFCKGYCRKHHARFMRYGDPLKGGEYHQTKTHDGKCSVVGCDDNYDVRGYCTKHYKRLYRHGDPLLGGVFLNVHDGKCSVEGCMGKYQAKGYCSKHWKKSEIGRASSQANKHKRRASKNNAVANDLTTKEWMRSLNHFNNKCAYCGCDDKKIHADHVVPLSKFGSHTITNIVPACETCNFRKNAKLIEEWYPKQSFYSRQRETKIYKWIGYKVHSNVLQATLF